MSTPDPESVTMLAKVMGAAAAVLAPVWGVTKWLDSRFDKKADKDLVNDELKRHRDYFVKVFDKMEEHQISDSQHFTEIRELMHTHHSEILRELSRKEDR